MELKEDMLGREIIGRDIATLKSGGEVLIDTRWTEDHGWETMVFKANKHDEVTDWGHPLDTVWYKTQEEAKHGHDEMIQKWWKR